MAIPQLSILVITLPTVRRAWQDATQGRTIARRITVSLQNREIRVRFDGGEVKIFQSKPMSLFTGWLVKEIVTY